MLMMCPQVKTEKYINCFWCIEDIKAAYAVELYILWMGFIHGQKIKYLKMSVFPLWISINLE